MEVAPMAAVKYTAVPPLAKPLFVLPQHLLERMREHLEVTLAQAQSASDEDILDVHPSIIRRRVLRYVTRRVNKTTSTTRSCVAAAIPCPAGLRALATKHVYTTPENHAQTLRL
jgi:hypothetical protein